MGLLSEVYAYLYIVNYSIFNTYLHNIIVITYITRTYGNTLKNICQVKCEKTDIFCDFLFWV